MTFQQDKKVLRTSLRFTKRTNLLIRHKILLAILLAMSLYYFIPNTTDKVEAPWAWLIVFILILVRLTYFNRRYSVVSDDTLLYLNKHCSSLALEVIRKFKDGLEDGVLTIQGLKKVEEMIEEQYENLEMQKIAMRQGEAIGQKV